jgi:hypothetical protein
MGSLKGDSLVLSVLNDSKNNLQESIINLNKTIGGRKKRNRKIKSKKVKSKKVKSKKNRKQI